MSSVWVTKRKGKRGTSYLVRWIEPMTGKNRAKTFKRCEDARSYEAQLRREINNGEYFSLPKLNYEQWVKQHLARMSNSPDIDLAKKTIAGQKEALKALGQTCNPNGPNDITPKMIRVFRKLQLEAGYQPRTINKRIEGIRSALSYAVRDEIIPSNKLLGPHRLFLRVEQKQVRTLEIDEVHALFNATSDLMRKSVISIAYYNGMRRNEICWLMWDDIDFDAMQINIVSRDSHRTKTRRSRSVALRPETAELLKNLEKDRVNKYLYVNPDKFYWTCDRWFPEVVKKAGIAHCTLQDLRATCNTVIQDSGMSREAAMQILGHSTASVNKNHYTGTLKKQQRIIVDSLPSIG